MNPKVGNLVIDCADLGAMAAFWGGLLGMKTTARSDDWLDLEPLGAGGPILSFQRVPEGKKIKNRLHLDLDVPDIRPAGERAERLGATPAAGPMGNPAHPFQVWHDPEGNEFCFCTAP
ncbi:VOC family protein [Actinomadura luteofluorescens]|uniref:Catechol 2,3-dioxygenase-like lactoylglutathione lyase family enzyme n=1 Tax=Actinomadura luteofluorescens TaxID=46163 RepID=A0A7Y9JEE7_9ACTN|nr:VOC family protein [Actinomadura luteofluorescens]NYD45865.1 catechol 2,3-dioxygenase-like lactoylglutathione lyase family enzyme [Actinomadura luteofluorescens]